MEVVAPREIGLRRRVLREGCPIEGVEGRDRALPQEHHLLPVKGRVTLDVSLEAYVSLRDAAMHRAPGDVVSEILVRVDEIRLTQNRWPEHELFLQAILQGGGLHTSLCHIEHREDRRGAKVDLFEHLGTRVGHQNVFHSKDHVEGIEIKFVSLELSLIIKVNDSKRS